MLEREQKVGYQNREGSHHDLPPVPYISLANHHIKNISGFDINERVTVCYSFGEIIIKKSNLSYKL
jgi:hypothetical protein